MAKQTKEQQEAIRRVGEEFSKTANKEDQELAKEQAGMGTPDLEKRREKLRSQEKALLSSIEPSEEEQQARKTLQNLISSRDLGVANIQDKPIAMPFITGQKQSLIRQTAAQAQPLEQRLSRLQRERQLKRQQAQTGVDIAERQFERAREQARPDESKVSEFTNPQGERVIIWRDNRTGETRREVVGEEETRTATQREEDVQRQAVERINQSIPRLVRDDGTLPLDRFLRLRRIWSQRIGDPNFFDDVYLPMLTPQDQARFSGRAAPVGAGRTRGGGGGNQTTETEESEFISG